MIGVQRTAWLVAGLLLTIHIKVHADPAAPGSADLFSLSLEQLANVTISGATLTDKSLRTAPSAVTVFTHEQIRRMGFDYLHELLNLVPGYQTARNAEWPHVYSYSARGRRNGSQSKEVLLLLDGRPVYAPRTGGPNQAITLLPLVQFERVEVIRGPGSALYGSGAYTGVINIITRNSENEAGVGVGSHELTQGHLLWSETRGDWRLDLFAHAAADDGKTFDVQDTFSANRITTSDPRGTASFDSALHYRDTTLRLQYRQNEGDDFYSVGTLSNGFNELTTRYYQLSLEQHWHWRPELTSRLYLGYVQLDEDFNTQLTAPGALTAISSPSSTDPLLTRVAFDSSAWQLQWHNDWQRTARSSIQFGLEWRRNNEDQTHAYNNFDLAELSSGITPVTYYGDFDQFSPVGREESQEVLGVYGQYQQRFRNDLHLTLGARFDDYRDVGSHISPRLGLVKLLNEHHTLKLLYGEAFRAPALNETGLINNPAIVGNPDLEHEVVKTWDLLWQGQWSNTYVGLGWFQSNYEQPIIAGQLGSTRTFVNGADERSRGLELEFQHQLNMHWRVGGSLTRFTELPSSALREAEQLGALWVNGERQVWNWHLAAVYHGRRDMLTPGDVPLALDDYWLVNSKLRYRINPGWHTALQVKNLLDKDILTPPEGNNLTEGIPSRGREWLLAVELTF